METLVGKEALDFEADAYHDGEIKKINLRDFRGKWVVLIFYPADFTFVCPTELEEMAEMYDEFRKVNADILSISTDTAYVHKAWHDTSRAVSKVRFPMVADPTGRISRAYGTYIEDEGVSWRATFIIDPDGVVRMADIHDNSIGRSAKEILRRPKASKFVRENPGHACPASWEPGMESLKIDLDLVGKI